MMDKKQKLKELMRKHQYLLSHGLFVAAMKVAREIANYF